MKAKIVNFLMPVVIVLIILTLFSDKLFTFEQIRYVKNTLLTSVDNPYYHYKKLRIERYHRDEFYTIAMIGDSLTDDANWDVLTNRTNIMNMGISADTTEGLLTRLEGFNPSVKKAFLMIGVNDVLREKASSEILLNIQRSIALLKSQNVTPILQSILYVGESLPKHYNKKIMILNEKIKVYAKKEKIEYINLNKRLSTPQGLNPLYHYDNVHLNEEGYKVWSQMLTPYL